MHREHALLRHDVVHDGKDALLHFAGVLGTQDHKLLARKVQVHRGLRGHAASVLVGRELTRVDDDVVGFSEALELFGGGADEHVPHEERVIGAGADDADLHPVLRVPASEPVDDVQLLLGIQKVDGAFTVDIERLFVEADVDLSPPDVVFRAGLLDNALVVWAAAGLLARVGDECARRGDERPGLIAQRLLVQERRRSITEQAPDRDILCLEAEFVRHLDTLQNWMPSLRLGSRRGRRTPDQTGRAPA